MWLGDGNEAAGVECIEFPGWLRRGHVALSVMGSTRATTLSATLGRYVVFVTVSHNA